MQSGQGRRVIRVGVLSVVAVMVGVGWYSGGVEAQIRQNPTLQRNPDPILPPASEPGMMPSDEIPAMPPGPMSARLNEERIKAFNDERHKRLEEDVSKLQALTSELKADVSKTNESELSAEDARKTVEIEKLAHDVQNRMKN